MTELKPCPFCPNETITMGYDELNYIGGISTTAYGQCVKCNAKGPSITKETGKCIDKELLKEATEAWNRRVKPEKAVKE